MIDTRPPATHAPTKLKTERLLLRFHDTATLQRLAEDLGFQSESEIDTWPTHAFCTLTKLWSNAGSADGNRWPPCGKDNISPGGSPSTARSALIKSKPSG